MVEQELLEKVNTLIDKAENLRGLLESDINSLEEWNDEIIDFLDALDEVEGTQEWKCLKER